MRRYLHRALLFGLACLACLAGLAPQQAHAAANVLSVVPDHSPVQVGDSFSVTVTYDGPMDTAVNPVISFPTPGEDPGGFLQAGSAAWLNATTFRQTYAAQAVTVFTGPVDVGVDGGRDGLGGAQVPYFQADVFDISPYIPAPHIIDMRGVVVPEDVFVTPAGGAHVIADADVGKTVEFIIRYDIPTDYGGPCGNQHKNFHCPDIVVTNSAGTPLTLTNPTSEWQSRTRYKVTWTIADGNEDLASINVRVAGGVGRRDDPNNRNTDAELVGVFSIDTRNPTVSAVVPSPAVLRSNAAAQRSGSGGSGGSSFRRAGELFSITVTFSEPMDTTSTPVVSFPNHPAVAAVLSPTSGSWTDSTHYVQTFIAGVGSVNEPAVDVLVTGALDANGNPQVPLLLAGVFSVALGAAASVAVPTLSAWNLVLLCAALGWMGARRHRA